jgi:hypothetical protein
MVGCLLVSLRLRAFRLQIGAAAVIGCLGAGPREPFALLLGRTGGPMARAVALAAHGATVVSVVAPLRDGVQGVLATEQ